jgi:xylan 1,4-beta-xylosidase
VPESSVPPLGGNISFHAQHAPMGACFSFTLGRFGSGGGFSLRPGQLPIQDVFIGVKHGDRQSDSPVICLPFYEPPDPARVNPNLTAYPHQVQRHYGWATDRWGTPDFDFTLYTPFGGIVEPGAFHPAMLRVCLLPAIVAEFTIDNTAGTETKTGVFAINFKQPGSHVLPEQHGWRGKKRVGFGLGRNVGVQATLDSDRGITESEEPFPILRGSPDEGLSAANPVHGLGTCPGIGFEVPPGKKQTLVIAMGVYDEGIVTTGIEGRFFYTRHFSDLTDVLDQALRGWDAIKGGSAEIDRELIGSDLSSDQQFLIAHSTRSYYANTQLLDVAGEPFWVVHSGDSGLMNVFDEAVDQVFWELKQNPWVVRNRLDNFVKFYSYQDQLKPYRNGVAHPSLEPAAARVGQHAEHMEAQRTATATASPPDLSPGGISFCHDMGVHGNFAPRGCSSYELPNQSCRFSFSAQEQLCNWILLAASYVARTGDVQWLRKHEQTVDACTASMWSRASRAAEEILDPMHDTGPARSGPSEPAAARIASVMLRDSARCGIGSETVSYAALDPNYSTARGNLYLAVKSWAAYLGLAYLYNRLGRINGHYSMCIESACATAAAIAQHVGENGVLPAVLDPDSPGRGTRCLAAAEALIFPVFWLSCEHPSVEPPPEPTKSWFGNGKYQSFLHALKQHTRALLGDELRREMFGDGGLRISSTSSRSWLSKLAICQYIAREVFYIDDDPEVSKLFAKVDSEHVRWQTDAAGPWAWCDEFDAGKPTAARFSPRGITTTLWLK